jgi:hypothetical protein
MDPIGHFKDYVEANKIESNSIVRGYDGNCYYNNQGRLKSCFSWFRIWETTTSEWACFGHPLTYDIYYTMAKANYEHQNPFDAVAVIIDKTRVPSEEVLSKLYANIRCYYSENIDPLDNMILAASIVAYERMNNRILVGRTIEDIIKYYLNADIKFVDIMLKFADRLFIGFGFSFPNIIDKDKQDLMIAGVIAFILVDTNIVVNPFMGFHPNAA